MPDPPIALGGADFHAAWLTLAMLSTRHITASIIDIFRFIVTFSFPFSFVLIFGRYKHCQHSNNLDKRNMTLLSIFLPMFSFSKVVYIFPNFDLLWIFL